MTRFDAFIPKPGDVLGRYRLVEELGRGGFGIVFRATDLRLEVDVAVKVMIPQISAAEDASDWLGRFDQEALILKKLRHPATIRILDHGHTPHDLPYFVLEFAKGRPLATLIAQGPTEPARVVRIAEQVLGALEEAHHHGVVHRDLKPDNIIVLDVVGGEDAVKVLDFGIAKLMSDDAIVSTRTGLSVGTPRYMAPEQLEDFKNLDGRADLYSLGLILAECLTGRPVVQTDSQRGQMLAQVRPEPHALDPYLLQLPIASVIQRATAKDRDARFASAPNMRAALREAMTRSSGQTVRYVETSAEQVRAPVPGRDVQVGAWGEGPAQREVAERDETRPTEPTVRRRHWAIAAGLGLAVLVVIGVFMFQGESGPDLESALPRAGETDATAIGNEDMPVAEAPAQLSIFVDTPGLEATQIFLDSDHIGTGSVALYATNAGIHTLTLLNTASPGSNAPVQHTVLEFVLPARRHVSTHFDWYDDGFRPVASSEGPLVAAAEPTAGGADVALVPPPPGFVRIPAGTFTMGSPEDEPGRNNEEAQHTASITRDFWLQAHEVTQGEWRALMGNNPSRYRDCGDDCPVERVSWYGALAYANARSRTEGLQECYALSRCSGTAGSGLDCSDAAFTGLDCSGYRLPTEAEWEYAARAGTPNCEADEGCLGAVAWYSANADGQPHPVGRLQPNGSVLYDMLGNVWEWTWDWYGDEFASLVMDPLGSPSGVSRVARGGSWVDDARNVRFANRGRVEPVFRNPNIGLRLARSAL